jgi:hypothetical protein
MNRVLWAGRWGEGAKAGLDEVKRVQMGARWSIRGAYRQAVSKRI